MSTLFAGRGCADPETTRAWCKAHGILTDDWWGMPNSFRLTTGREVGRGWILLRKRDLNSISLVADHSLVFSGEDAAHVVTLSPITLLHARCITPGAASDAEAVYVCEVVDRRHHLARIPVDKAYNVRKADGSGYLANTLNSGVAWTWQQIVNNLSNATLGIGDLTLPFTPDATPESLVYYASYAWDALSDVLDRIACTIRYNPTTNTFAILRLGSAGDAELTTLEDSSRYKGRTWDGYCSEYVRGELPEKVRVHFWRRPSPTDGSSPYYTVDVTLTATSGVVAGTYVNLFDDLVALGATGTPSNSAACSTRATERATDWRRKHLSYERRLQREYRDFQSGAVTAVGSAVALAGYDDRGGLMRTVVLAEADKRLEKWKPLTTEWLDWMGMSSGGSITVEEVDGTPSYTGITTIRFDQADGFVVTNPSAGVARIDLTVADEKVKVSSNDTTTDYLFNKVVAGSGITITEINDGGNEDVQIATSLTLATGSYTPTVTGVANTDSVTAHGCFWYRIGDIVTVFGRFDVDATTTATLTQVGISLPVAANFTTDAQCQGTGSSRTVVDESGMFIADATNDRAEFRFIATSTASQNIGFVFSYTIPGGV